MNQFFKQLYDNFKSNYIDYNLIYTDGSKIEQTEHVGCAFVCNQHAESFKLHRMNSIYSAELQALYNTLLFIKRNKFKKSLIFTDSLSSLQSLCALNIQSHPYILNILKLHDHLLSKATISYTPGFQAMLA